MCEPLACTIRPLPPTAYARTGNAMHAAPMPSARPWWAFAFPCIVVFAALITVFADTRWLHFDPHVFSNHDKLLHFLLYGACGFAAVGWFHRAAPPRVIAIVVALVILEELSQGLFPHRSVDTWDFVASCGGAIACGLLAWGLRTLGASNTACHAARHDP